MIYVNKRPLFYSMILCYRNVLREVNSKINGNMELDGNGTRMRGMETVNRKWSDEWGMWGKGEKVGNTASLSTVYWLLE